VASVALGTLLLTQGNNLSSINTTNGSLIQGPTLSNTASNGLTFVGKTLYGSEAVPTPRQTRLVTIDPATGGASIVGPLPPSIDAIEGIPAQSATMGAIVAATNVVRPMRAPSLPRRRASR
jgi:hypothetical protein